MDGIIPTTEMLFIAGCVGALSPMLVAFYRSSPSEADRASGDLRTAILYMLLGGYVATFVVPCNTIYKAFLTGVLLDGVLMCMRKVGPKWLSTWPQRTITEGNREDADRKQRS